ncbi:MAG: hypothetical protein HQM08_29550 [Candidatus Riflebacteria bacterium]|nr:hypothetical protein [Candidatus Riflebacteria bacterium]
MNPDIIAEIRFKTSEEGGRKTAVGGSNAAVDFYGCPFIVDGKAFDCRLLLGGQLLELGQTYHVPVKFLNSQFVLGKLFEGKEFILWEGKPIGSGKVLRIVSVED